uniref:DNA-processing protein DprA n=1 Tax=Staphylococcus saprophyticus TaxID=29385 RepID=UPI0016425A5E
LLPFPLLHHYPKQTKHITHQIQKDPILITQYLPLQNPKTYHFPQTNTFITPLSKPIFITQSPQNTPTTITTRFPLQQNRDVYVL